MTQPGCIAVLNAGSSSIKFALYRQAQGRISAAGSRISAWVLPTDEERRRNLT
jgi:acetate kinase